MFSLLLIRYDVANTNTPLSVFPKKPFAVSFLSALRTIQPAQTRSRRARAADKTVIDRACGGINPPLMDLRKKINATLPGRVNESRPPDGSNE